MRYTSIPLYFWSVKLFIVCTGFRRILQKHILPQAQGKRHTSYEYRYHRRNVSQQPIFCLQYCLGQLLSLRLLKKNTRNIVPWKCRWTCMHFGSYLCHDKNGPTISKRAQKQVHMPAKKEQPDRDYQIPGMNEGIFSSYGGIQFPNSIWRHRNRIDRYIFVLLFNRMSRNHKRFVRLWKICKYRTCMYVNFFLTGYAHCWGYFLWQWKVMLNTNKSQLCLGETSLSRFLSGILKGNNGFTFRWCQNK